MTDAEQRPGEGLAAFPARADASVFFIGRIGTPWTERGACPKRGDMDGPECRLEVFPPWAEALDGVENHRLLQVLYWMHLGRRDLVRQVPRSSGRPMGTFALRSPMRPNPIASSVVRLVAREGSTLIVAGLDCVDGTPLIDIKPERCPNT